MNCRASILLYGDSGDGKTTQIGEFAEYLYRTRGEKTRLYTADPGGWGPLQPLINVGVIEAVNCLDFAQYPFEMIDAITQGASVQGGKLVIDKAANENIGLFAHEGLIAYCDLMMADLADKSAKGINVGGGGAFNFKDGNLVIGSNNQAHYGQVQSRIYQAVMKSQRVNGAYVLWTSTARRGEDPDNKATVLGPQAVGKALTAEIPRWFNYTFRIMHIPEDPISKAPKGGEHRLYLNDHKDQLTPGAKVLGNSRLPMGMKFDKEYLAPADIVKAITTIESKVAEAEAKLRERLGMANQPVIDVPTRPVAVAAGRR